MKLLILCLSLYSPFIFAVADSKVVLPLEEYTRLKKETEAPHLTVIESVSITGDYGKNLSLKVKGANSGKAELVEFMDLPKGSVYDCKGNALLQKNQNSLQLLSEGSRFSLECTLSFPNWNEANLTIMNALFLKVDIHNGDVILGGETARQSVILTRTSSVAENDKAEVTVVGHHRLTVLPEEARFEYRLQLSNPGRTKKIFSLPLRNGEMVQSITADGVYKDTTTAVEFTLNPGINTVSVSGRFQGGNFRVPLPSAQNFLLIENSPMLQLSLETKARRVSVQDTGMYSQYSTSRAYLLTSNEAVSWTSKKLEVFTSTGFSVNRAHYTVYVPRKGAGIVEAGFEINNQGTPEIPFKVPNKVTYVEIGGVPQVLLKDPSGALLIQVPTGIQNVLIQYEGSASGSFVGQMLSDQLIRPAAVMSDVSVELKLSPKWEMVYGKSLFETKSELNFSSILWGILFSLLLVYVLRDFGLMKSDLLLAGVSSFFIFSLLPNAGSLFVAALVIFKIYGQRQKLIGYWPKKSWAQITVVALGLMIGVFIYARLGDVSRDLYNQKIASVNMVGNSYEGAGAPGAAAPMMAKSSMMNNDMAMDEVSAPEPMRTSSHGSSPDYQGVPARVKIPNEGRVFIFNQGMIDTETLPHLRLFLVDQSVTAILLFLSVLLLGVTLYRQQKKILDAIRARV
jgi:hypothetical protein